MGRSGALVAAALAALTLAACGEKRETSTGAATTGDGAATTPAGPVAATVAVTETEYALDPQDPKVARAGVVEFRVRNAGRVVHALEVEGPGGEAKTASIAPGGTATLRVDLSKAGTYEWFCPIDGHKGRGMKGAIVVGPGGSQNPPTQTQTQAPSPPPSY